jgi:lysine-N-methylase
MSNSAAPQYTAFRYMARFRCIGSECESSCCTGGWQITIDREHYKKTRQAMGGSPAGRQDFDSKIVRVKNVTHKKGPYALVVLQSNGDCGFLDTERLCSLQKNHGEAVLSETCAVYPRSLALSGSRRELAGLPSCPEVARQLLLHDDAMELDEVSPPMVGRPLIRRQLGDHPVDPYTRYHDELRNLVMDVLSDELYPLSSRLSFVSYFASRSVELLKRGKTDLDEGALLEEVERIQDPAIRVELHKHFQELPDDAAFPSRAVLAVATGRSSVPIFRELLDRVLAEYGGSEWATAAVTSDALELRVDDVVRAYSARKQAWSTFAPRIDRYLTNYAKNYWAREWYSESPDLLTHQVRLLVRLAAIRFLLFGHPLLAAALGQSDAQKEQALDRAAVECVQRFSRAFDHSEGYRDQLHKRLASAQVLSLAHAICLARF